jgi:hypothetical protein
MGRPPNDPTPPLSSASFFAFEAASIVVPPNWPEEAALEFADTAATAAAAALAPFCFLPFRTLGSLSSAAGALAAAAGLLLPEVRFKGVSAVRVE